jgi:hypothetical protein
MAPECYVCSACSTLHRFPHLAARDPNRVHIERCSRCGAATSFLANWGQVISWPILPLCQANDRREYSMWVPAPAQPLIAGLYEARFKSLEPNTIFLNWDGRCFRAACGDRVALNDYMGFRGKI